MWGPLQLQGTYIESLSSHLCCQGGAWNNQCFQEYRQAGDPFSGPADHANYSTTFTFIQQLESPDVRVEREVWAYPTISFIADLGGALSLFLGVSFLSTWDLLDYICSRYQQNWSGK